MICRLRLRPMPLPSRLVLKKAPLTERAWLFVASAIAALAVAWLTIALQAVGQRLHDQCSPCATSRKKLFCGSGESRSRRFMPHSKSIVALVSLRDVDRLAFLDRFKNLNLANITYTCRYRIRGKNNKVSEQSLFDHTFAVFLKNLPGRSGG